MNVPSDLSDSVYDTRRLAALRRSGLLDSAAEESFDRYVRLASTVLGAPVSLMSLVDDQRQFFKSATGLPEPWATRRETPLSHSFCRHAVTSREPLVIDDARVHPLVHGNPAVTELGVISYLGVPIITREGHALGVFCVIADQPRNWTERDLSVMKDIAAAVVSEIELRIKTRAADEANARLRAVIDSSIDPIVGIDVSGRVTDWNRAAERTFGYPSEEALGRDMSELIIPPALRAQHNAGMQRFLDTGKASVLGKRLLLKALRRDGTDFPVELTVTQISPDYDTRFMGYLRDIAEEQTRQEELERSRAMFRSITETTPDILTIFDVRANVPVYTNREVAATLGYSPEEVVGFGDAALAHFIHPDDLPRIIEIIRSFDNLRDGEVREYDYRARRRDGTFRWFHSRTVVFTRTPDGRAHQVLALAQDVTNRREQEDRLRESEERLRLGLEAGNTGTWDWDIANNRVAWSERVYAFHGVALGEFGGTVEDFQKLIHPDDLQRVGKAIEQALRENSRYQVEFRVVHGTGEVRWLTTTGKAFFDETGRPIRMLGATSDITERKHAEAERDALLDSERAARSEAERANRLKDEFLATVSHELRTPLNAILGYAQLLRMGRARTDVDDAAEVIERNARAQNEIINDLLDMSRIVTGKLRLDVQPVNLGQVIDAALETVRPAADAKGIRLVRTVDPSAGPINGDPSRLQQVVWNLLTNAVKFTSKGGKVQVVLARVNSHVEVTISDTGQGIGAEFLPYVFEKFRQSDASSSRQHGGLGLGLALVKSLVEMHGGVVRAHSSGRGEGASFTVELPLSAVQHDPADSTRRHPRGPLLTAALPLQPVLDGITVLVVDDEADSRDLVRYILEGSGARVVMAEAAQAALDALGRESIDLLLSDIGMPGVDGYELIRTIRSRGPERGRDVPAVALTAFARSEDRTRALMAGYQMHIAKPVEPLELAAAVASLARRRSR